MICFAPIVVVKVAHLHMLIGQNYHVLQGTKQLIKHVSY